MENQIEQNEDELFNQELIGEELAPTEIEVKREVTESQNPPTLPREEVIPGYTREELATMLSEIPRIKSSLDKTNGTYGSKLDTQQKIIDDLKEQLQEYKARVAQQEKETEEAIRRLTPEKLPKLNSEYPSMAELLAEDLDLILNEREKEQSNHVSIPKLEDLEDKLRMALDEERQAREKETIEKSKKVLDFFHSDWVEVASYSKDENGVVKFANPAFAEWVASQPEEKRNEILTSNDPYLLAGKIKDFKEYQAKNNKNKTLANAVQPRGVPASQVSVEDEEERLFREELAREYD